ncbi:tetraspanin-19-like [Centropristis striata]|uniref:tetraspanin-19-like n=1 Tax=Centropristis striata TaxID=184440 RepID=UPI0027E209D6|nr:tetraspanin-19-like [Centropristis striata]
MKLEVQVETLNYAVGVLNSLFLLTGSAGIGFGLFILFGDDNLMTVLQSKELVTVGVVMMLTGVLMAVVVCLLAPGARPSVLPWYAGSFSVLILAQLFVILLMLLSRDKVQSDLDLTVDQIIVQYRGTSREDSLMDKIQRHEACCGRAGPADWQKNLYVQNRTDPDPDLDLLPCSCFNKSTSPGGDSPWCEGTRSSYDQGCQNQFSHWLMENSLTVVGMQLTVIVVELVQVALALALHRALRRMAALQMAALQKAAGGAGGDEDDGEKNFGFVDPDGGYDDPAHPAYRHDDQNSVDLADLSYRHGDQNS